MRRADRTTPIRPGLSICLAAAAAVAVVVAMAQSGPPPHVRSAVDAVMTMLDTQGDEALEAFVASSMVPDESRDSAALVDRLEEMRTALRGLRDDVSVEREPDGVRLILGGGGSTGGVRLALDPRGITEITLVPVAAEELPPPLALTRENLAATFERLEGEGFSGVVHVRLDGEIVLQRPFGMANAELGIPIALDTVFGTGSRPIDYTKAAIYLLEQRGALERGHTIERYFEGVPADKTSMTIEHLMTGASGLPNFVDTAADWDPDLAWIDRAELERRVLSSPLLFPPGDDSQHSHAAFGLLAALIERVSGESYYDFLRRNFFDPAGMTHTGMYGESRGMSLEDFAVGGGPSLVGVPNIPPNWGPTSWLVMGSGGMYSTLPDLLRFYELLRAGDVLEDRYAENFRRGFGHVDGSERGFELFHVHHPPGNEMYLMVNMPGRRDGVQQLFRGLTRLTRDEVAAEGGS